MSATIASLSEQGWIQDPSKILNFIISYYILSDVAQSVCYQDNIINLPETYYKFINDPDGMGSAVKSDLDKLVSKYFDTIDINVSVKALTDAEYGILLSVSVIDKDGNKIELTRIADINRHRF